MLRYEIRPENNYLMIHFSNKQRALKYGRSITDSTNRCTSVYDLREDTEIGKWCFSAEKGGKRYKAF